MSAGRLHGPTVRGRLRSDRGLLVLTGLIVALTTALLSAVAPLTARSADRAVAHVVRDASPGGAVVATLPPVAYRGIRQRDPDAAAAFEQDVRDAQAQMPPQLAAAVEPAVASLTSASLPLVDAGAFSLRLVYLQTPTGSPALTWTAGAAPASSAGAGEEDVDLPYEAPSWPVQVALSERAAATLGAGPGDVLSAEDEYGVPVEVQVSGVFQAEDPGDEVWRAAPELLSPAVNTVNGSERTSTAALVSPASLPDLRIAVASDQLTERISFAPLPERVGWAQAPALRRAVVGLKAAPGLSSGAISWDSLLDLVLDDALEQVATARGQAQVLLVGLVSTALLTLALAALLLVRRRSGSLTQARERGASLLLVAAELAVEALLVALAGAALGLGVTAGLVGSADWSAVVPVVVAVTLTGPVLGAAEAARATDARRVPANRSARQALRRTRQARRLLLEAAVVAVAALALVALRQRGAVDGDLTPASAPTWLAVLGALVLVRLLPALVRLALRAARRTPGRVRFFVLARVAEAGTRALPLVVVTVAVAQLVLTTALAATEQRGQEAGALLAVGGDARLTTAADPGLVAAAGEVGAADGVRAVVAARVDDGVRATGAQASSTVRLVVVDAVAYARLLEDSELPDAPQLARLTGDSAPVPALLVGGPAGLADDLRVRWGEELSVPLDVVGEAPRVGATTDPVVVVDAARFEAAGARADPDTVWAVGTGASAALRATADDGGTVTTYADVLAARRAAPLASALVDLSLAGSLVLLVLAGLGVVLGAAADAPGRAVSLGRLRALGLPDRELRRILTGELLVPVAASVVAGLAIGTGCAAVVFDPLGLELVTGQSQTPELVVPVTTALGALLVLVVAWSVALREGIALRRMRLARLLRGS